MRKICLAIIAFSICPMAAAGPWVRVNSGPTQEMLFEMWAESVLSSDTPIDGVCGLYTPSVDSPYGDMIQGMPQENYPWDDCAKQLKVLERVWKHKLHDDAKSGRWLLCRDYPSDPETVNTLYSAYMAESTRHTNEAMRKFFRKLPQPVVDLFWDRNRVIADFPIQTIDVGEDPYAFLERFCAELAK